MPSLPAQKGADAVPRGCHGNPACTEIPPGPVPFLRDLRAISPGWVLPSREGGREGWKGRGGGGKRDKQVEIETGEGAENLTEKRPPEGDRPTAGQRSRGAACHPRDSFPTVPAFPRLADPRHTAHMHSRAHTCICASAPPAPSGEGTGRLGCRARQVTVSPKGR